MASIAPFVLRNAHRVARAIALHIQHRRSDHLPRFSFGHHHPSRRFLASLRVDLIACTFSKLINNLLRLMVEIAKSKVIHNNCTQSEKCKHHSFDIYFHHLTSKIHHIQKNCSSSCVKARFAGPSYQNFYFLQKQILVQFCRTFLRTSIYPLNSVNN